MHGRFTDPNIKVLREGVKDFFFYLFLFETKKIETFRYGLPKEILSKGLKATTGGGEHAS